MHSRARFPRVGHVSWCIPRYTAQVFPVTSKSRLSRLCHTRVSTASSFGIAVLVLLGCGGITWVGHSAQRSIAGRCAYPDLAQKVDLEYEDCGDKLSQSAGEDNSWSGTRLSGGSRSHRVSCGRLCAGMS